MDGAIAIGPQRQRRQAHRTKLGAEPAQRLLCLLDAAHLIGIGRGVLLVEVFDHADAEPFQPALQLGQAVGRRPRRAVRIVRVVPGNGMPGAGSLKATQYVYGVAPKDGTTLATVSRGMATDPLLNDAKFDATKFTWIGSITSETSICATWQSSPTKTWDDMFRR